nr:unnamed protein product [Callosobruchus analis]
MKMLNTLNLNGNNLTVEQLVAATLKTEIRLSDTSWKKVDDSRNFIEEILAKEKPVYGVNTGLGSFSEVVISPKKLLLLQNNIIRSHAAGVGKPLSPERVKRMLILRLNLFAKGHSGISRETLSHILAFCNAGCVSKVPEQGSVGASGDLAPLAHLALGMLGEGDMWDPELGSWQSAKSVIDKYDLPALKLKPREGLSLINGTQMIVCLGAEAIHRAENLVRCADIITSISVEVLKGTVNAFSPLIHRVRPHPGQQISAKNIRSLLNSDLFPSEISKSHNDCKKVQDAYSIRCAPQVHGIVYDTLRFVKEIIETEMNSATDNPLVFLDNKTVLSGGNFHGEYPGKALDYLTIAVSELGSISERRIEQMVNRHLNGLPAFLVKDGGFNSGLMIPQTTAAALVSENKTLCHPATADSVPTNAAKEDHVSMGNWAARKCLQVLDNVEYILGIELMTAIQGIELHRPLKSTKPIESVFQMVRDSGIAPLDADRFLAPDMEIARNLVCKRKLLNLIQPYWEDWGEDINNTGLNHNHDIHTNGNRKW